MEINYEQRAEWLADYGATESQVYRDREGDEFIIVSGVEEVDQDGQVIEGDERAKPVYLPAHLQA